MDEKTFGQYQLLDLLGRGGMGEVWKAFDTATDRVVALKLLPATWAQDPTFQERFRREARVTAGLREPHVIPIHRYGEIDGQLYVDMRLIDGRDLESVLADGPVAPERAVAIVDQVAQALSAAHAAGLVHRDVKPSNILVTPEDFAYLIDFGIARTAGESPLTNTDSTIGTFQYMAPERLNGEDADARADVYGLACVLFECLTGRRAFPAGNTEALVTAHLTAPPPLPSSVSPELGRAFDNVISRGMAKDPNDRHQSTAELARDAKAALTGTTAAPQDTPPLDTPPQDAPPSLAETRERATVPTVPAAPEAAANPAPPKPGRKKPILVGVVAIIAILALIGVIATQCGTGDTPTGLPGGNAELGATNDINPQDPATLQQGGILRLSLSGYPPNFNTLHTDGNLGELGALLRPTMPRAFRISPNGETTVNTDYFTSVELTNTDPQEVTYTINPEATWSDGTPITWEDIASQINATKGIDPAYRIAAPNGSERVAEVKRGVDDRQAIIVFASHYADWQGMFAGNTMLYPKSMTENPEVFEKAQLNGPGPSAGPFRVTGLDKGAQRITLTRNPDWWGTPPLLDSITFTVLDDAAKLPALQNNAIDAVGLGSLDDLKIAQNTPGISIRRAPAASWYHFTFNGAEGSILEDPALRVAIIKGIDRQAIADITQRGLVDTPRALNNHIYLAGQEGYQDNSIPFDAEAAKRELDALGWKMDGQFRRKDGRELVVRDVFYDAQSTRQVAQIAQANLAQIGVNLQLNAVAGGSLFTDYVNPGNFDIVQFAYAGDAFALSSLTQIYAMDGEGNRGHIGSPEIDAKIDETLSELDPAKARVLANELDKMIWDIGHSTPLFQSAGNVGVRSTLANYGPAGIGDLNYSAIGFMKP